MDVKTVAPVIWGRKTGAEIQNSLGGLAIILVAPYMTLMNWIALEHFEGSLTATLWAAVTKGPTRFAWKFFPQATGIAFLGYFTWLCFQALLYTFLPGPVVQGQRTPGGYLLNYCTNGLAAWFFTHILYVALTTQGLLDPAFIARNWEGLLVAANVYGFSLSFIALTKGYLAPSHPEDRKFSGSLIFDFWAGVELNPRFGRDWDWKWFHNDRPGIVAWSLIDISFAAYQYQTFGHVTNSMLIVLLLHSIYALDLFYNEAWYTRTPDISHDHFGFYLAWGDTVFLPTFYTLQAQFLARYPIQLSTPYAFFVLAMGLLGYYIFRSANHQRDFVRNNNGQTTTWGKPAQFIACTYSTMDGKLHKTILLTSGWWGAARHVNYLGDMIMAAAMCAACGLGHVLPWSYYFFLTALLCHRMGRNDARCESKYGEKWEQYCKAVPYKLIPGIY